MIIPEPLSDYFLLPSTRLNNYLKIGERFPNTMKALVLPTFLCAYILSVFFASPRWDQIYESLAVRFDLSENQIWLLPIAFNLLVAFLGVLSIAKVIHAPRRKESVAQIERLAMCVTGGVVVICLYTSFHGTILKRKTVAGAFHELTSASQSGLFGAGKLESGTYSNAVVGLAIDIPEHWHMMSLNSIRRTKASGGRAMTGESKVPGEDILEDESAISTLLAVTRYPKTHQGYNPSLALSAYDKAAFASSGIPTLEAYIHGVAQLPDPMYWIEGPSISAVGGRTGYRLHMEGRLPPTTIQQHVYATETDSFYVVAVVSVQDERDLPVFQQAIGTLRFTSNKKRFH